MCFFLSVNWNRVCLQSVQWIGSATLANGNRTRQHDIKARKSSSDQHLHGSSVGRSVHRAATIDNRPSTSSSIITTSPSHGSLHNLHPAPVPSSHQISETVSNPRRDSTAAYDAIHITRGTRIAVMDTADLAFAPNPAAAGLPRHVHPPIRGGPPSPEPAARLPRRANAPQNRLGEGLRRHRLRPSRRRLRGIFRLVPGNFRRGYLSYPRSTNPCHVLSLRIAGCENWKDGWPVRKT